MQKVKLGLKVVLAAAMVAVGIAHFVAPEGFVRIVPAFLPVPLILVYVSGFCEMAGGAGLLLPRTQRAAAWGLIALYVAVFPANINMAIHHIQMNDQTPMPVAMMWLRLPFQALFIAWAFWFTRRDEPRPQPIG
jgi:uncharacterized membrane protein